MIDLVLIYNHKYESNIAKLDRYYAGKFRKIWHLVPFYPGHAENVIPVYDNSFVFQVFVAQAARKLMEDPPDRLLFLSDDLLLDPLITQDNAEKEFGLSAKDGFVSELHDLSKGQYGRGVTEARKITFKHHGLEIGGELPPYDEAKRRLTRHIEMESMVLRNYVPYIRKIKKPLLKNAYANWKLFKGNIWHAREKLLHRFNPVTLEYPLLGGYSDIFSLPVSAFEEFVHYCGVLAAARVFVEIAIPTAIALSCPELKTEASCPRQGFNVWFPIETYEEMERKMAILNEITRKEENSLSNLVKDWDRSYLYMHPLKLSKWKW